MFLFYFYFLFYVFVLSTLDDDYLQNASAILEKLKSFYTQGGESSNLSKLLQDYTQVISDSVTSYKFFYVDDLIYKESTRLPFFIGP